MKMIKSHSDKLKRKEIIHLKNVRKDYVIDEEMVFTALKKINLKIEEGEYLSIVGPSGSGKSTLMHIIGLLDYPTDGEVIVEGKDVSHLSDVELSILRNRFVGFVFQQFNLINKLTVWENILLPAIYSRSKLNFSSEKRARYLLDRFGIGEKKDSYPNKLSGGQQQRVAIARALIMNPQLILADEPTGNLDSRSGKEVMSLLTELNRKDNKTVVVVTHDMNIASYTKRLVQIRDGVIISDNNKR